VVDARSQPPQPSDEVELVRSVVDLSRFEHVAALPTVVAALWSCRLHAVSAVAVGARSERGSEPQEAQETQHRDSPADARLARSVAVVLGAMLIP
jgi:hypothetical protein